MTRKLRFHDLFCGGGGTTQGAEQTGLARAVAAVNHWPLAIETHSANHPHARHFCTGIDDVSPRDAGNVDLLFASPECTHHSRARGGRPTSDQQRSDAWGVLRWVHELRPSHVVIENVVEFRDWGPVGGNGLPIKRLKGKLFLQFVETLKAEGYKVDDHNLNAADFGAATSRTRMFLIARKGNRYPRFPEPTHSPHAGDMHGRPKWRGAEEVIDWTLPLPSVFRPKRPLADNTLARVEAGLRRFVGPLVVSDRGTNASAIRTAATPTGEPVRTVSGGGGGSRLMVPMTLGTNGDSTCRPADEPAATFRAKSGAWLIAPHVVNVNHGDARHANGRTESLEAPMGTASAVNGRYLAAPFVSTIDHTGSIGRDGKSADPADPLSTITSKGRHVLAAPYLVPNFGEAPGQRPRTHDAGQPMPAVTGHGAGQLAVPWLDSYYGNGQPADVSGPLPTVVTKDRHALAAAICGAGPHGLPRSEGERKLIATMAELGVVDVGFRMLANHELSAAQGFPADYVFAGNKTAVTRQIGNSVSPDVAAAIVREIAA